jgi:hypothetical protein
MMMMMMMMMMMRIISIRGRMIITTMMIPMSLERCGRGMMWNDEEVSLKKLHQKVLQVRRHHRINVPVGYALGLIQFLT